MATVELKGEEWKQFSQADYAVIDCYGDGCFACVLLEPVYDGVADELAGIRFGRINITHSPEIADVHGVDALPTLLCFRKGELVHRATGSMEREELLGELAHLLYD